MVTTSKAELLDLLKEQIVTVTFTKKDGTERVMRCTLREDTVVPYERKTDKTINRNDNNVIHVWDIENDSWRSFKFDSIKSFYK